MKITRQRSTGRTNKAAATKAVKSTRAQVAAPPEAPLPKTNLAGRAQRRTTHGPLQTQIKQRRAADKTRADALLRSTLEPALFASTVPETNAIVARRLDLEGAFHPAIVEPGSTPTSLRLSPRADAGYVFGGERYVELPNSTSVTTTDPKTGCAREFVLTRGVRPYTNEIDEAAHVFNAPKGYVSDVLLFERTEAGLAFRDTLLRSAPEKSFLFEDPRVSAFIDEDGRRRVLLSGTDYAPHAPGSSSPDVMNRYVELSLDERGAPLPVELDPETRRPAFRDLSPPPRRTSDGFSFLDAKNAVVAMNEDGQLVVRTRFRPSPNDPAFSGSAVKPWGYGEQVFVFSSFADMQAYDWSHALEDLLGAASEDRVRPLAAKIVAVDDTLKELYPKELLAKGKGKGFGPGAPPVRVRRVGDEIFLSEGKGAREMKIGVVPRELRDRFPIADGGVSHLTFDHEVRYCVDRRASSQGDVDAVKRVYSASIKLWDRSLTKIEKIYADAVQPLDAHQRSGSGILDLHHTYPMGRVIAGDERPVVRVSSGECDAHTASYDFDVMALLVEMADGGARERSGQVYALENRAQLHPMAARTRDANERAAR
jgi:hypothetical protein